MKRRAAEIERLTAELHTRTLERDFNRDQARAEIERLTEEVNALRLVATAHDAEVERLRGIVRDLLWAIGHDNERALNDVTARARAALEPKP